MLSELFHGEVEIRHVPGANNDHHVVTFDCYHDERNFDRAAFGEHYFRSHNIAATHILTRDNDWFQYPFMREVLARVKQLTDGAGRVLAYGSSMGGYGAIRFADAVGANAVFAMSPQYSIDPAKVPFERRWAGDSRRITFLPELDGKVSSSVVPMIVFDPVDLDRRHVDLFKADISVTELRVPYAGHPCGGFLVETLVLGHAVHTLLFDTFDEPYIVQELIARRAMSPSYWSNLADAQPPHRSRLALALAQRAANMAPGSSPVRFALGRRLAAMGREDEAMQAFAEVVAVEPHPAYLYGHAHAMLQARRYDEAVAIIDRALALAPSVANNHYLKAVALWRSGDFPAAAMSMRRTIELDPTHKPYRRALRNIEAGRPEGGSLAERLRRQANKTLERFRAARRS